MVTRAGPAMPVRCPPAPRLWARLVSRVTRAVRPRTASLGRRERRRLAGEQPTALAPLQTALALEPREGGRHGRPARAHQMADHLVRQRQVDGDTIRPYAPETVGHLPEEQPEAGVQPPGGGGGGEPPPPPPPPQRARGARRAR